jgi:hypothetical protein
MEPCQCSRLPTANANFLETHVRPFTAHLYASRAHAHSASVIAPRYWLESHFRSPAPDRVLSKSRALSNLENF